MLTIFILLVDSSSLASLYKRCATFVEDDDDDDVQHLFVNVQFSYHHNYGTSLISFSSTNLNFNVM